MKRHRTESLLDFRSKSKPIGAQPSYKNLRLSVTFYIFHFLTLPHCIALSVVPLLFWLFSPQASQARGPQQILVTWSLCLREKETQRKTQWREGRERGRDHKTLWTEEKQLGSMQSSPSPRLISAGGNWLHKLGSLPPSTPLNFSLPNLL